MEKQVVVIHGGDSFYSYKDYLKFLKAKEIDLDRYRKLDWKSNLKKELGIKFDVILPQMPNKTNARYLEWEVVFKKIAPLLQNGVVLIGHSMGGIFLAKYLTKNKFPRKIRATFLVAAPFDEKDADYPLGSFNLPKKLSGFIRQGGEIFVYQSKDDSVVPFVDFYKYKKALPKAHAVAFEHKDHFNQEKFPELAREIKQLF